MARLYTEGLVSGQIPAAGLLVYTVPDGYRTVVRCVDVLTAPEGLSPVSWIVDTGVTVWQSPTPPADSREWYGWRGEQAFEAGTTLSFTGDEFTMVSVTGWVLTVP